MERVEYDPEIDPSIREEREAAEREKELTARIRVEIERYAKEREEQEPPFDPDPPTETEQEPEPEEEVDEKPRRREEMAREREEKRREKAEQRALNAAGRRKAIRSLFTGSILSSEWVRRMFPYLLGAAVLLLLYIGGIFHLQRLHRTRQRLDEQVRELSIKAVEYSARKAQNTQRSAIVKQLEEKEIPLKEFPNPAKTVSRR